MKSIKINSIFVVILMIISLLSLGMLYAEDIGKDTVILLEGKGRNETILNPETNTYIVRCLGYPNIKCTLVWDFKDEK